AKASRAPTVAGPVGQSVPAAADGRRTSVISPKNLYAMLYLVCIPLFACVYYFFLPSSFYHSTVQFEYPTMNRAANEILRGIRGSIIERIGGQPRAEGCESWRIDPDSIRVSSLAAREGKIGFTVSGQSSTEGMGHGHICGCSVSRMPAATALTSG